MTGTADATSDTLGAVAKEKRLNLRVSDTEYAAWTAAAESAGLPISEWIRRRCNGTQTVVLEAPPPKTAKGRRP